VNASVNGQDPAPEDRAVAEARGAAARADAERLARAPWLLGLAGILAGLAAFGIGEATYKVIRARLEEVPTPAGMVMAVGPRSQAVADVQNAALTYAVLGGCLGLFLGVAGGLVRRSGIAATAAGLLGVLLGAGPPAGVTFKTLKAFSDARVNVPDYDIPLSMLMHGLIWGLAGGAAGLAFAVGMGSWRRLAPGVLAGFLGAVLGTVAFELIGIVFFPLAETGEPLSTTWTSRLAARLLVALATAAGVILSLPPAVPARAGRKPAPLAESGTHRAT
jgi:hypothetical protein